MVSNKSFFRSFCLSIGVALLMSASACVFSRTPVNDVVLGPDGEIADKNGSGTIVDGDNDTVTGNNTDSDEVIEPSSPTTPNADNTPPPAEEPTEPNDEPSEETPPVVPPPPSNDVCRRIAYASSVDGFEDRAFVGTDCNNIPIQNAEQGILVSADTNFKHARPTFSPDGEFLTTSLLMWRTSDQDSIRSLQSIWNVEGIAPELKHSVDGDRDNDGITDSIAFLSLRNPTDTTGLLTIRATMAACGNGIVEGFEVCDDGNQNDTDACNNQCALTGSLSGNPSAPIFAKSLVYLKKATDTTPLIKRTIVENESSLEDAIFTKENSVIFSARLNGDNDTNLYAYDLEKDGSVPIAISGLDQAGVQERQPALSPDGNRLVYNRGFEIWTCELMIARLLPINVKSYSCVNPVKVSTGIFEAVKNLSPCYAHDGENIFFISNAFHGANGQEHDREVWRVNTDGSSPVNISDNDLSENTLACSPAAGPTGTRK